MSDLWDESFHDPITPEQAHAVAANWKDTTQLSNALDATAFALKAAEGSVSVLASHLAAAAESIAAAEARCTGYCIGTARVDTLVEDLACPVHGIEAQRVAESKFPDRQAWLDSLAVAPVEEEDDGSDPLMHPDDDVR